MRLVISLDIGTSKLVAMALSIESLKPVVVCSRHKVQIFISPAILLVKATNKLSDFAVIQIMRQPFQ